MTAERVYTDEMGERICAALAASERGIRAVLNSDPDFPSLSTFQGWMRNHASLSVLYARAKQQQLEAMAEDIVDISMDDSLDPNDKRIRIDTRKWLLSKLMSKTYGDKLDVTSGGEALAPPSHQIDARVQSIIMQAQQRMLSKAQLPDLPPEAQSLLE